MPNGMRSVGHAPRGCAVIDAERLGGDCAMTVSKPWPRKRRRSRPRPRPQVDRDARHRSGQTALSTNMAMPAPTSRRRLCASPGSALSLSQSIGRAACRAGRRSPQNPDHIIAEGLARTRGRAFRLGGSGLRRRTSMRSMPSRAATTSSNTLPHILAFVTPGRAIGCRGGLVGHPVMSNGPVHRHPVRAGQDARRHVEHARAMGAHIGALVVEGHVVDGEDVAVASTAARTL